MKYFTTDIKNVKINGIEVPNALIVNGTQDGPTQPELTFLIPDAYRGVNIMGSRYVQETQTFEQVDQEPVAVPDPLLTPATKEDALNIMDGQADIYMMLLGGGA